jgi:hypothetical protein
MTWHSYDAQKAWRQDVSITGTITLSQFISAGSAGLFHPTRLATKVDQALELRYE